MNEELIVKGKIRPDGTVKPLEDIPYNIKGDVYIAFIPTNAKKYFFCGSGRFKWTENNPIIEIYKDQEKKRKAYKNLMKKLRKGYSNVKISGKVYKSRNELYEKRFKNLGF